MVLNIPANKPKPKLLPIHVYFKENLRRFLVETSLNGLKYIEDIHRNIWERGYFLISFSIVFTSGIYMALYFLKKWETTPVIIGISPKANFIQDMPFPAITLCNMNQALASKVKDIEPDTPEYAMLQSICFQDYNYSRFANFKPRFEEDRLVDFKLKHSQNCTNMIIYCKFGPYEEPCSNLFRDIFLDEGICCVFNRLHPFFIFKGEGAFIRDYTSIDGRMSLPVNWSLETGYEEPLPASYYPRKAAGSGANMGLTVVLNANIDEYYCSSTNGAGFKVLLYNPVDAPYIRQTGLPIMVGHETRMRINTKYIESQHSLRKIKPKERQCYFSDEKNLNFYKYYTRRSCESECDSKQMQHHCQCVPYHLPEVFPNVSICFISEMDCVVKTGRFTLDPFILKCKENCLPGCHELQYFPDMFVTPLATKDFNLQDPFFRNMSKETMNKNLAMIQIYYKDNHFRGSVKVPYTQFADFLSQTGGIMSLMVGFSVISVAEVFYFVLLKPFFDMFMKRNPVILESKDDEVKHENFARNRFHPQMLIQRRKNIHNRVMVWDKRELEKYRNEKY